jgi:hypothetical protein
MHPFPTIITFLYLGLDARAALLVMNALRRIANTGRTIVGE